MSRLMILFVGLQVPQSSPLLGFPPVIIEFLRWHPRERRGELRESGEMFTRQEWLQCNGSVAGSERQVLPSDGLHWPAGELLLLERLCPFLGSRGVENQPWGWREVSPAGAHRPLPRKH